MNKWQYVSLGPNCAARADTEEEVRQRIKEVWNAKLCPDCKGKYDRDWPVWCVAPHTWPERATRIRTAVGLDRNKCAICEARLQPA